jgi:hypothetical protein
VWTKQVSLRKTLWLALTVLVSLGLALLVVEWLYRLQLIDTYRPELHTFNPSQVLVAHDQPTLLVMGDSFTAGRMSYAGILQDTLREWRVINAAVTGTGVLQALFMAPSRFAQFHPAIFLYQVYVGNDLFDIRYPLNWRTISPGRNVYWFLANHLRVIGYLNYRLRQLKETLTWRQRHPLSLVDTVVAASAPRDTGVFSVEHYDSRVKLYVRAEPTLIEDSILVQGKRQHDYAMFLEGLAQLLTYCKPEVCRAYILVIPHVCQVDAAYITYLNQLGARFTTPAALGLPEYPFLVRLREHLTAWPNVDIVNPLPRLRQAQAQQAMYDANDEHLSPAGQHEIAALLRQQLHLQ